MKICPRCSECYPDDVERCPRDDAALNAIRDPLIGRTVAGRYRLISRLGRGGMSSVYLARHVMIDRLVAVKTLRRDLAKDPIQRDRFIREARAVNRINHANIVDISDFGEGEDGLVYLVMEYVAGDPLHRLLEDGPLSATRAIHIAGQIASALSRAHQMGVVHRDLKPDNILIVQRKDDVEGVKVLDFGIAKILDAPSLTGSQQIFGTPGYIAPEYIQSTNIDGRADLYSLGVILYEMVTGALPFDYEYPGDLLVKHVTELPIPPHERYADVEEPMERLILQCLEKDPANRFRDAFHFLEELSRVSELLGSDERWGGLSEDSPPTPVMGTRHIDPLARTRSKGSDTIEQDRPPRMATLSYDRPTIPEPPSVDGVPIPIDVEIIISDTPAVAARSDSDGALGVRRWRMRFDALRAALDEIEEREPAPAAVVHAMALAESKLEDLERGLSQLETPQRRMAELEEAARDYRATLGRAIEDLGRRLSLVRGDFEQVVARRDSLRAQREAAALKVRRGDMTEGKADALLWELATVDAELAGRARRCDAIEVQLAELKDQLERESANLERELSDLAGRTEGELTHLDSVSAALRGPLSEVEAFVVEAWGAD
ncbi:MAG: protein kinase [Deltaproteobacteria bacterium]|nr:protein kinase [Deltaproteobacteria bacterium]